MDIDGPCERFLERLGSRLRAIRKEKGWTLEQAEAHGVPSWRHLQKIEAGKNITVATLWRLSRVYKIPMSDLFKNL